MTHIVSQQMTRHCRPWTALHCHQSGLSLATGGLPPGLQPGLLLLPGGWRWCRPAMTDCPPLHSTPPPPSAGSFPVLGPPALQPCQSGQSSPANKINKQTEAAGTAGTQPTTTNINSNNPVNISTFLHLNLATFTSELLYLTVCLTSSHCNYCLIPTERHSVVPLPPSPPPTSPHVSDHLTPRQNTTVSHTNIQRERERDNYSVLHLDLENWSLSSPAQSDWTWLYLF